MLGEEPPRPPRQRVEESASPLPKIGSATAAVAENDPTLEQPVVEELLAYQSDEVGVLVLTRDDQFYDTVQGAVGNDYPVLYAQSRKEAMDAVMAGDCGVLITDAGHSPLQVEELTVELKQHLPSLVTIVAGRRDDGDALMDLLSSGHVHRFLLKPISPGQTKLLVDSSARRHLELREQPELLGPIGKPKRKPDLAISPKTIGAAAAVVLLVAVGLAVWLSADDQSTVVPAATVGAVALPDSQPQIGTDGQLETAVEEGFPPLDDEAEVLPAAAEPALPPELLELLANAEAAFMEGRLAEPPGDNALDYYQAVLGMDPNNSQAAAGVSAIIDVLFNQAERALVEERLDAAAAAIDQIREIEPTHPRLSFMDVQWSREQQRIATATAPAPAAAGREPQRAAKTEPPPRAEPPVVETTDESEPAPSAASPAPHRPSELDRLISATRERLNEGAWVNGSRSAKASLVAARERDANNAEVKSLWEDLQNRVLGAGQAAVAAGDLAEARSWLAEARDLGVARPQIAQLENAIATAERSQAQAARANLLANGLDRLQQDRLMTPADDSALTYLSQLRDLEPGFPGLESALVDLSRKMLRKADEAARGSDWTAASVWLDQAQGLGVNQDMVGVAGERIRTGMRQAELLAEVIPAAELTLVAANPPDYPRAAVRRNQEGWVELEFTVARDGTTQAIRALAAEPAGVFDAAAVAALETYVFQPYEEAGQVYERRAVVRVRFALE